MGLRPGFGISEQQQKRTWEPSVYQAMKGRSLPNVKKRGGWQRESSLKQHENAARLNASASQLKPRQAVQFKRADEQLAALFFGRVAARPSVPLRTRGFYFANLLCGAGGVWQGH